MIDLYLLCDLKWAELVTTREPIWGNNEKDKQEQVWGKHDMNAQRDQAITESANRVTCWACDKPSAVAMNFCWMSVLVFSIAALR